METQGVQSSGQKKCKSGCYKCKCSAFRRIMNNCVKNNGDEKCETFRTAYEQCLEHYKPK